MSKNEISVWKKVFGVDQAPVVNLSLGEISSKAQELVGKMSISGVQPKFSVRLIKTEGIPELEITSSDGEYILKPQVQTMADLPQNEEVCMTIAEKVGINVPGHCVLPLKDQTLAYVVKRFDRIKGQKIHQEDFAQILGKTDKYQGSVEEIGKKLNTISEVPGLDRQLFFERVVFSFLIGNGDAHLKNYSINRDDEGRVRLSPAYDLVSSRLVIPKEEDDSALTINGKKNNLKRTDFETLAAYLKVPEKVRYIRFTGKKSLMEELILKSQLSEHFKKRLKEIVEKRYCILEL